MKHMKINSKKYCSKCRAIVPNGLLVCVDCALRGSGIDPKNASIVIQADAESINSTRHTRAMRILSREGISATEKKRTSETLIQEGLLDACPSIFIGRKGN